MANQERAANEAPDPHKCELLAEWAGSRRFEDIEPARLDYLKTLALDTIGCAIGALPLEPVQAVHSLTGDLGGAAWCTLVGGGKSAADPRRVLQRRRGPLPLLAHATAHVG